MVGRHIHRGQFESSIKKTQLEISGGTINGRYAIVVRMMGNVIQMLPVVMRIVEVLSVVMRIYDRRSD